MAESRLDAVGPAPALDGEPIPQLRRGTELGVSHLAAYGIFGLPLAFAALPIYVHVPKLYADGLGVPLATVGGVLLGVRIFDAISDPMIGWVSDRVGARKGMIALSLPLLGAGMFGLLSPPPDAGALWMGLMVLIVTLGFSAASINYGAWGAEVAHTPHGRTRVVAAREGFALIGVVLAAALPGLIADDEVAGLAALGVLFLPLLLVAAVISLGFAPAGPTPRRSNAPMLGSLGAALMHRPFRLLIIVFAANGIAAAVPATTVLFFVSDLLGAERLAGLFLVLYFVAGAASLPLWVVLSRRIGKVRAWFSSMLLAIVVFIWAWTLGPGDVLPFAVICVLSGMALGADLALPPAMLADLLARDGARGGTARAGAWFGWWNFVTKANLALAAGLALPLLAIFGYASGSTDPASLQALAAVYALLPVALKICAAALLWALRDELDFAESST